MTDHAEVRATALNEAAAAADRIATAHREGEYGDELTSREVRDAIETVADELRRMAATARPDAPRECAVCHRPANDTHPAICFPPTARPDDTCHYDAANLIDPNGDPR